MPNKVELGKRGQEIAEEFLIKKGWHILERNFRAKTGEIDLIGRDDEYIVFVEVKYRRGLNYGYPRESVGYTKQQHIRKTAMFYIAKNNLNEQDFRFDVIEVLDMNGKIEIECIKNAF